jgi:hypothetical protein
MENREKLVAELKESHQAAKEGGRKGLREWGKTNHKKFKKLIGLSSGISPENIAVEVGCSATVFRSRAKKVGVQRKNISAISLIPSAETDVLDLGMLFPDPELRGRVSSAVRFIASLARDKERLSRQGKEFKKMLERMVSSISVSQSESSLNER